MVKNNEPTPKAASICLLVKFLIESGMNAREVVGILPTIRPTSTKLNNVDFLETIFI